MILNVYCYYNKLLEAFGNFQLDDHEEEKVIRGISKSLRAEVLKGNVGDFKYLELYKLGTFDDEKGLFDNDKKLLLDLGAIVSQIEAQKAAIAQAQVSAEKPKEA